MPGVTTAKTSGAHVDCQLCIQFARPRPLRGQWWAELEPNTPIDNLVHAFALHLQAVESENRSTKTLLLYDGRHRQFLKYLEEEGHQPPFALPLLSSDHVRHAATWLRQNSRGPRGGESAARALVTTLKTSSAWLADEQVLPFDPLARVKRPRVAHIARTPFAEHEIRALAVGAAGSRSGARDVAIIHLLLDTGMRVGELCGLRIQDVDLQERRLTVRGKGNHDRTMYFGSADRRDGGKTLRALRAYLAERTTLVRRWASTHERQATMDRLFLGFDGWPLLEAGVRGVLARLGDESSVQNVIPHRFRHTFATWYLVRHPGDETGLRGILGHLSDDMFRVYTHLAHEIIAQRAGRVGLSEAWLGSGDEPPDAQSAPPQARAPRQLLAERSAVQSARPVTSRFCPDCGYQQGEDARFCAGCGRPAEPQQRHVAR